MDCPACKGSATRVVDSRPAAYGVRRRRECEDCGERFTTHERTQQATEVVVLAVLTAPDHEPSGAAA